MTAGVPLESNSEYCRMDCFIALTDRYGAEPGSGGNRPEADFSLAII